MRKTFMGVQLRRLREERGLTQVALARTLGLSASYLNQIEQNQRPLTVPVLLKLHRALGVDIQQFSEDEEARLIAGLREALADAAERIALPELQEVATQMPALGRALIALHRRRLQPRQHAAHPQRDQIHPPPAHCVQSLGAVGSGQALVPGIAQQLDERIATG